MCGGICWRRRDVKELSEKVGKTGMTGALLVILASIGYLLLLAGGNPEIFLVDDNRTQWYPVMERAFADFWKTGKIYCYDFYQMKGMPVAEQGYYGVMNPFMLLAYMLTKLLPGGVDAITFYIGLMVVLGNFFLYLVCRRLGCQQIPAFLLTMTYGTMGCFWAFFYWYYVFNNYFLVPLLIYVFLRCTQGGKLSYCACGVVLAMDLWMGNVQYTFYHYMLFGVLCLTMIILKNRRYFMILCSNVAVGVGLSLPMFLLLVQASGGFEQHENITTYPLLYFCLLIHSVIPQGILRRYGNGFSFLDSYVMGRDDNLVCYMGAVGLVLFVVFLRTAVHFLKWVRALERRLENEKGTKAEAKVYFGAFWKVFRKELWAGYDRAADWSCEKKTMVGCLAALFCFLSLMSGGVVAHLLGALPVINNFRYLFKAIFPAVSLAVLLLAHLVGTADCRGDMSVHESTSAGYGEGKSSHRKSGDGSVRKIGRRLRAGAAILTVAFICVGMINARDTIAFGRQLFGMRIEGSFAKEKEIALSAVGAAGVDCKNYRMAALLQFPGVNDECFALSRNLTKNFATAVGAFSLAGYEIATPMSRLEMFNAVYSGTDFYAKYANADTLENFYWNLQEQPETVQEQLVDNSVRYLLLDKTTLADNRLARESGGMVMENDRSGDVIAALQALPAIRVERVVPFNEHYDLVELAGVDSLCRDEAGNKVPLTDENMQTLCFDARAGQDYILSFAWDSRLEAFATEDDGIVRPLPVEKMENGNIRISMAEYAGGKVTLTWRSPLCTAGFIWEGVTTLAFIGIFIILRLCTVCGTCIPSTKVLSC